MATQLILGVTPELASKREFYDRNGMQDILTCPVEFARSLLRIIADVVGCQCFNFHVHPLFKGDCLQGCRISRVPSQSGTSPASERLLDAIRNKIYANRKLPLMVLVYSQSFRQVILRALEQLSLDRGYYQSTPAPRCIAASCLLQTDFLANRLLISIPCCQSQNSLYPNSFVHNCRPWKCVNCVTR